MRALVYAAFGAVLALPALSFVIYRKKRTRTVVFTASEQTAHYFKQGVFLVRDKESFIALSAKCTHLGCTVRFDQLKGKFVCPCHKSVYDAAGKRLAGPAQDDLQTLSVTLRENGDIEVVVEV
ncbi:MAG: ubiquinol-cytochrome c reductase iron-sulfur subunit [Thermodesulfobacteriota bacterium]|nr:ubiquinol-cytochrome c reductase iron-sulfur subunit [Thermodesulfobacteriota bacterium]